DGMVVAFFMVGAVVLLRAAPRPLALCAACVAAPTVLAAIVVLAYAGGSVPTSGFGAAFVFAEVAVLTQGWTTAGVLLATAGALGLLAGLGGVSLVASVQMTSHISQAGTPGQERNTTALVTGTGLTPGQRLAIGTGLSWG